MDIETTSPADTIVIGVSIAALKAAITPSTPAPAPVMKTAVSGVAPGRLAKNASVLRRRAARSEAPGGTAARRAPRVGRCGKASAAAGGRELERGLGEFGAVSTGGSGGDVDRQQPDE